MYNVTDITEMIRHHLVLSLDDAESVEANLVRLTRNFEQMVTALRHEPICWMTCVECDAWVSSELIDDEGAGECLDGGFRCTECRFPHTDLDGD